jgi:hypothetical protein
LGSDASLKDSVAGFSEAMVAGAANQSAVPAAGWPHPSLVD